MLYDNIFKEVVYLNEKFTPVLFEGSYFKDFFYLLPSAFYGYFAVEALRGNFSTMLGYLPYFMIVNAILLIITHIVFNRGLKKYEAFG